MTLKAYIKLSERRRMLNRNERSGQAYFNTLADVRPSLAEEVRATTLDPFYDDANLAAFLVWVGEHWDG